jgi:hypothetical protein
MWFNKKNKNPVVYGAHTPKFRRPTPPPPQSIPNVEPAKVELLKEKDFIMAYAYKDCVQVVRIYDISYDSNGYPLFLIYINGQWTRKSAKYFKPYE